MEDDATLVLINVSPIEYGHVLLCPRVTDCLPQRITPELLLPPLYMAAESRNPYFRVGYNSLGAYATINHLHFQAYYLMEAFPIERAQTSRLPPGLYKKRQRHGAAVSQVTNYPVRCLCFERGEGGEGFESLADLVGTCCQRLQERNIPFNILIADRGARVFLIPQKFSHRAAKGEIPEDVAATGVNPAVFEISGHLLYKQQDDYDEVKESAAVKMLECASLTEDDFYETVAYMLADEGKNGAAETPTANKLMTRTKLERIPGSIDGGSRELPTIAASAAAPGEEEEEEEEELQRVPDMNAVKTPKFDRRSLVDLGNIRTTAKITSSSGGSPGEEEEGPASPTCPPLSSDTDDAVVPSTSS